MTTFINNEYVSFRDWAAREKAENFPNRPEPYEPGGVEFEDPLEDEICI